MPRIRPILSLLFILAFCVPSYSEGMDVVLCIENTGRITLGCSEIVDFPRYMTGQGTCSQCDCAPCTDVQLNSSTTPPVVHLVPPGNSPLLEVTALTEHLAPLPLETPGSLLDTGPVAILASAPASLRC